MLENVIGVEEAAEKWDLSAGYIKNLCAEGKIRAKKIGKTWVIDRTQEKPNIDLTKEKDNIFTSKSENRFFLKSEFELLGYDFDFKALEELTSEDFSKQIEDIVDMIPVKTFSYKIRDHHSFKFIHMYFYTEYFRKEDFSIIKASFSKEHVGNDYINIIKVKKLDFDALGMTIAYK
ncbi:hypothetical protein [Rossellomorea sp. LjRoot5]|uniref:hypothetical protein n=1 Tax=Rossellomorea sp. LjRoot5 TaxID=3342331 RepID=UPI003ECEF252